MTGLYFHNITFDLHLNQKFKTFIIEELYKIRFIKIAIIKV